AGQIRGGKIQIKVESLLTNDFTIILDVNRFLRTIANLLQNSIEAFNKYEGDSPARILIGLRNTKETLEIKISDNGAGIPLEAMKNLGKKGATYNKVKGTGLGLW